MTTLTETMTKLGETNLSPDNPPEKGTMCWVAPVVSNEQGEPVIVTELKEFGMDIYDLIETRASAWADDYKQFVLYTCGWASPNDSDGDIAPSQHPERKRVALVCLATNEGEFGSAMRIWNDPNNGDLLIENEGKGNLRDMAIAIWD